MNNDKEHVNTVRISQLDSREGEGGNILGSNCALAKFSRVWAATRKGLGKVWQFLKDTFREDPATYNERARRTPHDYPPVRGLR